MSPPVVEAPWQVVVRNGSGRRRCPPRARKAPSPVSEDLVAYPLEYIQRSTLQARTHLAGTAFFSAFCDWIDSHPFVRAHREIDIVCYGIGKFGGSRCARYQLALLTLLLRPWKGRVRLPVLVYDPQLDVNERAFLAQIGLCDIQRNEEGRRRVDHPTLFYMPHCGRALYNNVLDANWDTLQNICVLGNSLSRYCEELVPTDDSVFIRALHSHLKEDLCNGGSDQEEVCVGAFNDLALHYFPKASSDSDLLPVRPEVAGPFLSETIITAKQIQT